MTWRWNTGQLPQMILPNTTQGSQVSTFYKLTVERYELHYTRKRYNLFNQCLKEKVKPVPKIIPTMLLFAHPRRWNIQTKKTNSFSKIQTQRNSWENAVQIRDAITSFRIPVKNINISIPLAFLPKFSQQPNKTKCERTKRKVFFSSPGRHTNL